MNTTDIRSFLAEFSRFNGAGNLKAANVAMANAIEALLARVEALETEARGRNQVSNDTTVVAPVAAANAAEDAVETTEVTTTLDEEPPELATPDTAARRGRARQKNT